MAETPTSACCGAPLRQHEGAEGTQWYTCSACNRPADPASYRPWDRDEKLGPVPEGGFKPDDPKVIAWEAAHGHDLRLKCYREFGCLLLEEQAEALRKFVEWVAGYESERQLIGSGVIDRAKSVLDA